MNKIEAQQKKIEKALFELIESAGAKLNIRLDEDTNGEYRFKKGLGACAAAWKEDGRVILLLAEPKSDYDLSLWSKGIKEADSLLKLLEKERKYDLKNPNFYERVKIRFSHIKLDNLRRI